jgi:hypothetical protein
MIIRTSNDKVTIEGELEIAGDGYQMGISTYQGSLADGKNIWIGNGGQSSDGTSGDSTKGSDNLSIGNNALLNVTTGKRLVAIGNNALQNANTTTGSIAIGANVLKSNSSGFYGVGIGFEVMENGINSYNVAIGHKLLQGNNGGYSNITIGKTIGAAIKSNLDYKNVAVGNDLLTNSSSAGDVVSNVAIGSSGFGALDTGSDNVGVGVAFGNRLVTGSQNVYIGDNTGSSHTSGSANIFIGYLNNQSNTYNNVFSNCVYVGADQNGAAAQGRDLDATNEIIIGATAEGAGSNTFTHGNTSITAHYFNGQIKLESYTGTTYDDASPAKSLGVNASGDVVTFTVPTGGGGGTIDGSGTAGLITKWVDGDTIGDSVMQESSEMIGVGTVPSYRLHVKGTNTSNATDSFVFENSNGTDRFEWSNSGQTTIRSDNANALMFQRSGGGTTHRIGVESVDTFQNAIWKLSSSGNFRYSVGLWRTAAGDEKFVIGKTNNTVATGHLLSVDRGNGDVEIGEDGSKIYLSTRKHTQANGQNIWIGTSGENTAATSGSPTSGSRNVVIGHDAATTIEYGHSNAIIGTNIAPNVDYQQESVIIGSDIWVQPSGMNMSQSVLIGQDILNSNAFTQTDNFNFCIGSQILNNATFTGDNVMIGRNLSRNSTTGRGNIALGVTHLDLLTTGEDNVTLGNSLFTRLGTGDKNIGIGNDVGRQISSGTSNNIWIGNDINQGATASPDFQECIFIGNMLNTDYSTPLYRTTSGTNEIIIGNNIFGQGDNTFTHGNEAMVSHHFWGKLHSISKTAEGDSTVFHFQNSDNTDNLTMNGAGRLTLSTSNEIPFLINRPNGNGVLQFRNDANEGSITFFGNGVSKYGAGVIQNGDDFEFHIRSTNGTGDLPNMDDLIKLNSDQAKLHVVGATGTPLLYLEGDTTADDASNPQAEFGTLTVNRHGSMALNDAAEDDVTLIVQVNGDKSTGTQLTGTMSTTNGSSFFTGSGTSYDSELEAGSVIEKNGDLHTVYYVNSSTTGFFIDNSTDATGSHIFDNEAAKIIELKDGVGHTKLQLEQNGRLALGINPTSSRNTWFTIDNGYTNQGSIYKTGIHLTGENAGIQIGGSAGEIGGESIMIDQDSEDVGLVFRRTSHTDYKLSNKNSSTGGLTVTRDPSGTATEQMRFGSTGVRLGRTVSGDARTDVEVDGSLMINAARMYLGTETSDSSTTTPQILAGSTSPTFGTGTAAPKGSIYIYLGGSYNGSSQNFIWVKYSTGDSDWVALGV